MYGIPFREKGPNTYFFNISNFLYSRSLKCLLHIASYALRIGVSAIELYDSEFFISHTFELKCYICVVRTGNFIMYALSPFLWKRSNMCG